MSLTRGIKRIFRESVVPTSLLALAAYFSWHSVHGDRGLAAGETRRLEIAAARLELDRALTERDTIERRVNGLRGAVLERDLLDELARSRLNMINRNDIVVPYEADKRVF